MKLWSGQPLISHTYSGFTQKRSFFGKFGVLCILVTSVLRFAFLPYYRRFIHALKQIFYFICKHKLIQIITTFLWSILLFDLLIATLYFLVINGILLSCSPYFNLVFPLIFTYTSRETLMEISTFRSFFRLSPPFEI